MKPKIETLVCTQTIERNTIKVTGEMIIAALGIEFPKGAKVRFHVPGGGDWSNTAIDVDDEHPIYVEWIVETVTDSRK